MKLPQARLCVPGCEAQFPQRIQQITDARMIVSKRLPNASRMSRRRPLREVLKQLLNFSETFLGGAFAIPHQYLNRKQLLSVFYCRACLSDSGAIISLAHEIGDPASGLVEQRVGK